MDVRPDIEVPQRQRWFGSLSRFGRKWVVFASVGALVILLGTAILVVVGTVGDAETGDRTSTTGQSATEGSVSSSPIVPEGLELSVPQYVGIGQREVRIAEQAFFQEEYGKVSFVLIFENASADLIAGVADFRVNALNATGEVVSQPSFGTISPFSGCYAPPGQRCAIVFYTYLRDANRQTKVARLGFDLDKTRWYRRDQIPGQESGYGLSMVKASELTAHDPKWIRTDAERVAVLTFVGRNPGKATFPAAATVVYRDSAGRIIGGRERDGFSDHYYAPGDTLASLVVTERLPVGIDESRTEVFLDRTR